MLVWVARYHPVCKRTKKGEAYSAFNYVRFYSNVTEMWLDPTEAYTEMHKHGKCIKDYELVPQNEKQMLQLGKVLVGTKCKICDGWPVDMTIMKGGRVYTDKVDPQTGIPPPDAQFLS